MARIGILTDSLVQYPSIRFPGIKQVHTLANHMILEGKEFSLDSDLKLQQLTVANGFESHPHITAPTREEFQDAFLNYLNHYEDLLVILPSSALTDSVENATAALKKIDGSGRIVIIDSHSVSVGLGALVIFAARLVAMNRNIQTVAEESRSFLQHIYTLFNIPNLSYLYNNHLLDLGQAAVGEMKELSPNFTLDNQRFFSTDKMRNKRHITDYFLEYAKEFESVEAISFIHGAELSTQTSRLIRDHAKEFFPSSEFSEHRISLPFAFLFGPKCQGMVVIDSEEF